jgi:hypothetical protein
MRFGAVLVMTIIANMIAKREDMVTATAVDTPACALMMTNGNSTQIARMINNVIP